MRYDLDRGFWIFDVGDKVKIKSEDRLLMAERGRRTVGINHEMRQMAGEYHTIEVMWMDSDYPIYRLKECGWNWTEDMFYTPKMSAKRKVIDRRIKAVQIINNLEDKGLVGSDAFHKACDQLRKYDIDLDAVEVLMPQMSDDEIATFKKVCEFINVGGFYTKMLRTGRDVEISNKIKSYFIEL